MGQQPILVIRRYQAGDYEAVWELHNLALLDVGAHGGNGPWDEDLHQIETAHLERDGEFLVGLAEGCIVAMGALRRIDEQRGEIKRMRVHPEFQRRGFGQAILTALETRARELGYAALILDTTPIQVAAQALYLKNGYREVSRGRAGPFEMIYFEKQLVSAADETPLVLDPP